MRTLILLSVVLFVGCGADKPTTTVFPDGWTMTIEPGLSDTSANAEYDSFLGHKLRTAYPGGGGSYGQSQDAIIDRSIRSGNWHVRSYRDMNSGNRQRVIRYYIPITSF